MKRLALILVTLVAMSLFAAAPALADHWNRGCNNGYGGYGGYRGYSSYRYNPGSYGYHATPGRVIVGYRSVGGIGGYDPYGGYYNNYGGSPYGGYGYNLGPSFGFYFGR
jgi:hypothetical protein